MSHGEKKGPGLSGAENGTQREDPTENVHGQRG